MNEPEHVTEYEQKLRERVEELEYLVLFQDNPTESKLALGECKKTLETIDLKKEAKRLRKKVLTERFHKNSAIEVYMVIEDMLKEREKFDSTRQRLMEASKDWIIGEADTKPIIDQEAIDAVFNYISIKDRTQREIINSLRTTSPFKNLSGSKTQAIKDTLNHMLEKMVISLENNHYQVM